MYTDFSVCSADSSLCGVIYSQRTPNTELRDLNPPETRATFDRLIGEGYSEQEVRNLIGCVVAGEIFEVLKHRKPFNHERFVEALRRLPELPDD
jgi:hypothetical protein